MKFSRGYIYEFRTRYSYTNTEGINVVVVPIIHLYIDFKKISLFEMKSRLFHEFGHAIHTILSQNNYQELSPYNMRAEYAEIMSQFFELYIFTIIFLLF
jgi:Zn-dependent oligopeptidase